MYDVTVIGGYTICRTDNDQWCREEAEKCGDEIRCEERARKVTFTGTTVKKHTKYRMKVYGTIMRRKFLLLEDLGLFAAKLLSRLI